MSGPSRPVAVFFDTPGWRPAFWLRTVERGKHKGWYIVRLANERRTRIVHPDRVKAWAEAYGPIAPSDPYTLPS